jgi:mannosylglycerate hydrolase
VGKKTTTNPEPLQCHFISNTHWDREWRYSAQRTRYMLVYLLDMLFDIFEKEPGFKYFHLDSQTMPIQDYLEARPERTEVVRKYVSEGRLQIGPWFCLPDEYCVGGESLVRNLLLGHKIAGQFGAVSKTGYSPFSWGQISQMPQLYRGFGIDVASFYRGINTEVAPHSEFYWEGPDGSRIIGSRLATRPRYNVWYVIQRPVYWNCQNENNRYLSWKDGKGPFRLADSEDADPSLRNIDYQYAHPPFDYHSEHIAGRAAQALREQDAEWTTPHRFWSAGHDSSCPDIREARMIADCDAALGAGVQVFHSTVAAWQDGVRANQRADWPVLRGEMHHSATPGSPSVLYGWIISSRTYIKQDNFRTERALTNYAEPAAVFAGLLGAPYPGSFIDLAYYWLLQNHGHDSIGACARDIVHEDMLYRSRQSREMSSCVFERAMMDIVGAIDLSSWPVEDMALVVFNPAPFARSEVVQAFIDVPGEWNCAGIEMVDERGKAVACQFGESGPFMSGILQSPNDVANTMPAVRYDVRAAFEDVPGMGYRTFRVKPAPNRHNRQPKTMLTGPQTMANEYLTVTINANGSLDITDLKTGRRFAGQGYFRDSGETGHPWEHHAPVNDAVFTTLNEKATVALVRDGELEAAFRVTIDWALPECRTADDKGRSPVMKPFTIENTIVLRKTEPWVHITTKLNNTIEDHYLQAVFPSGIRTDTVMAQGQFDVVARRIETPEYARYIEPPQAEQPMNSFVDISDGKAGLALMNEGLKAYTACDDTERSLCLTLLRCYPLRLCVTSEMIDYSFLEKGSQCPGPHSFRYAVMPHTGDWAKGEVWRASERFNLAFRAAQIGPTAHGTEPMTRSFLELKPDRLHVSAVKSS